MKQFLALACLLAPQLFAQGNPQVTAQLHQVLTQYGFTGTVGQSLTTRLGRPINQPLANLGRMLFFDQIPSLHSDNSCSGCHSPTNGFGDTQPIAVGIDNNGIAGPDRSGPRNQRRAPQLINTAFYPKLMWNGRFAIVSGDPFNTSAGFMFPPPEGTTYFLPSDPEIYHLLVAQGHMPPTEMTEVAGFTGTKGTIGPLFDQFDDGKGTPVPPPDSSGSRNEPIRQAVLKRLNASPAYLALFGAVFPAVKQGAPITFAMFGQAIAEFEFTLTFANAPIDQFARGGNDNAMTLPEKKGALIFFGSGGCVQCHAVSGQSNEMFSDFQNHNVGIRQLAPQFGVGLGDVLFDGPANDEDYGEAQISGNASDRYHFRTAPLRNLALSPAYFHDGIYRNLKDAVSYHLEALNSLASYVPPKGAIYDPFRSITPPTAPIAATIDPLVQVPVILSPSDFNDLIKFLNNSLLDPNASNLCGLIPSSVPSGAPLPVFEGCK